VATISKRDETLVIELSALERSEAMHGDLEDWKFSEVIVGCEDPEALQAEIAGA
jgi:hypothetical protein